MTKDEAILLYTGKAKMISRIIDSKSLGCDKPEILDWWQCKLTNHEELIEALKGPQIGPETSDGYHTFNELYHHRAVLFSVIVRLFHARAWKAKKHHDGTMYGGMFIVGIDTPNGQATYHYDIEPYWTMFECKELDKAPEWDGHTPQQAIERISVLREQGQGYTMTADRLPDGERLASKQGWVRTSERLPTEEDADADNGQEQNQDI